MTATTRSVATLEIDGEPTAPTYRGPVGRDRVTKRAGDAWLDLGQVHLTEFTPAPERRQLGWSLCR